jgi:hypothetical protein
MRVQWCLLLVMMPLLTGCTENLRQTQLTDIPLAKKPVIPATEQECKAASAFWTEQGLPGGSKSCAVRTADDRKICTDSAQCEGTCLVAESLPVGSRAVGSCSEWAVTFGCHKYIEGGQVREICSD